MIDQRAGRNLFALVIRDPDLAECDGAGGEIEHQRRFAAARKRSAERIGADAAVGAAERRDERIARHIDEVKRDEPGVRALLGPVTDAANMMRAAQAHRTDAKTLRAFDTVLHRLIGDNLAEAFAALDGQHRAGVAHHLRVQIELEFVVPQRRHITRNHPDAMRIVTGEIRGQQMVGDQLGLTRRTAGLLPDRLDVGVQRLERNTGRRRTGRAGIGHSRYGRAGLRSSTQGAAAITPATAAVSFFP